MGIKLPEGTEIYVGYLFIIFESDMSGLSGVNNR